MKKRTLIAILALSLSVLAAIAQLNPIAPIERDPELRYGVAANGTSYYIRHNAKPKAQADFYIVFDVGAIQEDDSEQGLAHFLEHMAFKNTKHFPDGLIDDYLQSIGVSFGSNLNASTSWDVTQYMITDVPVERESVVDSVLMILHDWSYFIEPTLEDLEQERGVISEELRTRDNADWRSMMALVKALAKGTKYEHRNIIGYLEGLRTFAPESLDEFYHKWYRPEHQAIIIVGDVDVDLVEKKLLAMLADIPRSMADAPQKEEIIVADNKEPIISIYTDPEMQYSSIGYYIKRRALDRLSRGYTFSAMLDMSMRYMSVMQRSRFDEISNQPDAPFLYASMGGGLLGVIPTMEATVISAESEDGHLPLAFKALVCEIERLKRYGFTQGEFQRAKQSLMRGAEREYLNRNDRFNSSFIDGYIDHFRYNESIPSAEAKWQLDSTIISSITLADINKLAQRLLVDENVVVAISAPEKEGVVNPTEDEVLQILLDARVEELEPYQDEHIAQELIEDISALEGSLVAESEENQTLGTVEWRLGNGAVVVVKPSQLKSDEVLLSFSSEGGASLATDADYHCALYLPSIMASSGLSEFSSIDLGKMLSGKIAGLSLWVDDYANGGSGSSSPADIETLLQLLYLNFTSPRFDEADLATFKRQLGSYVSNMASDPDSKMSEHFVQRLYANNPRKQPLSQGIIEALNFESLPVLHKRLFGAGANFRFTIIGNVDLDTLRPLVEKYIGSLPAAEQKISRKDDLVRKISGSHSDSFAVAMQQPKASATINYWGEMAYTLKGNITMAYLKDILDEIFFDKVREQKGGTYGVGISASTTDYPIASYNLRFSFDTNREQVDDLVATIESELKSLSNTPPAASQMNKVRSAMVKNYDNSLQSNMGWGRFISRWYEYGFDYVNSYRPTVESITPEDVSALLSKIIEDGNRLEVVMMPE
ncbi:MAG: insulinase family protein [Rikenellaceae bacterium]